MELYEHQPYIDRVIADAEASAYLSQNVHLAAVTNLRSHPEIGVYSRHSRRTKATASTPRKNQEDQLLAN